MKQDAPIFDALKEKFDYDPFRLDGAWWSLESVLQRYWERHGEEGDAWAANPSDRHPA